MRTLTSLSLALFLVFMGCKPAPTPPKPPTPEDEMQSSATGKFITISDIHLDDLATNVTYGCDAGTTIWNSAKRQLKTLIQQESPDFILFLGDLPVHSNDKCFLDKSGNSTNIHTDIGSVLTDLRQIATNANIPLLYLPGNNDGYGGDYHSFSYDNGPQLITPFTLDSAGTERWPIVGAQSDSFYRYDGDSILGFYSVYPMGDTATKNLKIITLNTVILVNCLESKSLSHCTNPKYKSDNGISQDSAARTQLRWFHNQLVDAHNRNDAVLIAMHIPPGTDAYEGTPYWLQDTNLLNGHSALYDFVSQVDTFKQDIVGILTSHTHMDELKRVFNGKNEFIELCISTPGITVNHGNNPGMKVFTYDPTDFELLDFTTWYASNAPTFDFDSSRQYIFSKVYGGSSARQTMYNRIASISRIHSKPGRDSIIHLMEKDSIYDVKSPKNKRYKHHSALDVELPNR